MTQHRHPIVRWLRTDRRSALLLVLSIPLGLSGLTERRGDSDAGSATTESVQSAPDVGLTTPTDGGLEDRPLSAGP